MACAWTSVLLSNDPQKTVDFGVIVVQLSGSEVSESTKTPDTFLKIAEGVRADIQIEKYHPKEQTISTLRYSFHLLFISSG